MSKMKHPGDDDSFFQSTPFRVFGYLLQFGIAAAVGWVLFFASGRTDWILYYIAIALFAVFQTLSLLEEIEVVDEESILRSSSIIVVMRYLLAWGLGSIVIWFILHEIPEESPTDMRIYFTLIGGLGLFIIWGLLAEFKEKIPLAAEIGQRIIVGISMGSGSFIITGLMSPYFVTAGIINQSMVRPIVIIAGIVGLLIGLSTGEKIEPFEGW